MNLNINIKAMGDSLMTQYSSQELMQLVQYLQGCDFGADMANMTLEEFIMNVRYPDGAVYCPRCGCVEVVKFGHTAAGKQRYKCEGFNRTFTGTTNTIFEKCHLELHELRLLLTAFLVSESVKNISQKLNLATKTVLDWRHKIGFCLNEMHEKDVKLDKIVEVDETYMRDSYKGNHFMPDRPKYRIRCKYDSDRYAIKAYYEAVTGQEVKVTHRYKGAVSVYIGPFKRDSNAFVMPRKPRYCHGKKKRGLSIEQQCFVCAVDRDHHSVGLSVGMGNCSYNQIEYALHDKLAAQSVICTDAKPGYSRFAQLHGFQHEVFKGNIRTRNQYGIQNINNYHNMFKSLIYEKYRCVSCKHSPDYVSFLNYGLYAKTPADVSTMQYKVKHLLQICANTYLTCTAKMLASRSPIYTIMRPEV